MWRSKFLACTLLITLCICTLGDDVQVRVPEVRYLLYDVKPGEGFNLQKEVRTSCVFSSLHVGRPVRRSTGFYPGGHTPGEAGGKLVPCPASVVLPRALECTRSWLAYDPCRARTSLRVVTALYVISVLHVRILRWLHLEPAKLFTL